jgi:peptidase M42 family hydrolase
MSQVKHLSIDMEYVERVLLQLLGIPSPTGRTDLVMQFIGDSLDELGYSSSLTRRGALSVDLPSDSPGPDRSLMVHADTTGAMVSRLKDNGRLGCICVGTFSARFAEGARVFVFADDVEETYTGTILPLKASGHAFGNEVDEQPVGWEHLEVRVDMPLASREDLEALGIRVGDHIALQTQPVVTPSGFVNSRHLDDKAGIAAALGALRAIRESEVVLPVPAHLLVTIAEEIGQGASHGLHSDVAEIVSIDNGVVAEGNYSSETAVTLAMSDSTGPFDYHLTRKLERLARDLEIPVVRDILRHYRSDVAAAIEAGAETRAALIGFGCDASHGWERTHLSSIQHVAELVAAYLQTDLTYAQWVRRRTGPLKNVPSSDQSTGEVVDQEADRFMTRGD